MRADSRTETLKKAHKELACKNLIYMNQLILANLEANPEADRQYRGDKDALRRIAALTPEDCVEWDGEMTTGAPIWGVCNIEFNNGKKLGCLSGGLLLSASVTWGTMVWVPGISPTTMTFNCLCNFWGFLGEWTNLQLWDSETGAFVGAWNGGGLGLSAYVGYAYGSWHD